MTVLGGGSKLKAMDFTFQLKQNKGVCIPLIEEKWKGEEEMESFYTIR